MYEKERGKATLRKESSQVLTKDDKIWWTLQETCEIFVIIVQFGSIVAKLLYFLYSQPLNMGSAGIIVTLEIMALITEASLAGIDNNTLFHDKWSN